MSRIQLLQRNAASILLSDATKHGTCTTVPKNAHLCLKRRGQLARGAHLDLGEASALRDDHVDGAVRAGPPVPALGVHRLARRRLPRLLRVRDHRLQPPTTDP